MFFKVHVVLFEAVVTSICMQQYNSQRDTARFILETCGGGVGGAPCANKREGEIK